MGQGRHGRVIWAVAVGALAVWACETTRNPGGIQRDVTSPNIVLTNPSGDTQDISGGLRFNISALDNLALKSIRLTYSGGYIAQSETTFTGQNLTYAASQNISFPAGSGAGGSIRIVGRATDGALNFAEDTIFVFLSNVDALRVVLVSPLPGALAAQNRGIPVEVSAAQNSGIAKIGFLVSPRSAVDNPTVPPSDSIVFTAPFADSVFYGDTLVVLASTGTFNVVGFAEDSAGRRGATNVVTVTIQSVVNDTVAPLVDHQVDARVEVDDTVTVRAQDPSAIEWIGFRVDTGASVMVKFDTINVGAGNLTDVTRRMSLGLAQVLPQPYPRTIIVRGYACDRAVARNCAYTNSQTLLPAAPALPAASSPASGGGPQLAAAALIDTIVVVAGVTVPLPVGGQIADAIFNATRNELYLTNPTFGRVEVFQVANTTFVAAGITPAGALPWGIALWPRDILGNYGDTIVVADAGGTQLSIIDVNARAFRWRQNLPNFIIQTYKVTQVGGGFQEEIEPHDLSDKPQYVATVCRPTTGATTCHADSIFALYSTTPTRSSDLPFSNRATLRMEKLINTTNPTALYGKFFWEIALTGNQLDVTDTLRIVLRRNEFNLEQVVLSACAGVTVELDEMGLGDRTFARNSGNFTHAFFGEGGNIFREFARVMAYDARQSLSRTPDPAPCATSAGTSDSGEIHVDLGMSPATDVSDFISNTGIRLVSIATNFNGLTNAVRAENDTVYYLDNGLRLKASSNVPVTADGITAPGMDMNYLHDFDPIGQCAPSCGGSGDKNNRLLFTTTPTGNIQVWDTYHGLFVGTIPVRDPITGPLRVARDAGGQLLFGVTPRGLVMVRVPAFTNPYPTPPANH